MSAWIKESKNELKKEHKFGSRDHWVLDIYSLTLKKREKVPSAWSQTFTKERTCSFWGKTFGWLCEGYSSSAGKDSTEGVRILFKLFFVYCVWLYTASSAKLFICCSSATRQVALQSCIPLNPIWFLGLSYSFLGA